MLMIMARLEEVYIDFMFIPLSEVAPNGKNRIFDIFVGKLRENCKSLLLCSTYFFTSSHFALPLPSQGY